MSSITRLSQRPPTGDISESGESPSEIIVPADSSEPAGDGRTNGCGLLSNRRGTRRSGTRSHGLAFDVKASTWISDSHGLFDYESRNSQHKTFKCRGSKDAYRIIRLESDVLLLDEYSATCLLETNPSAESVCSIVWHDDSYYVTSPIDKYQFDASGPVQNLWLVLRSLTEHSVRLATDDIVRFGRFQLQLKGIFINDLDPPAPSAPAPHRRRRLFAPLTRRVTSAPPSLATSSSSSGRPRDEEGPPDPPPQSPEATTTQRRRRWRLGASQSSSSVSLPGRSSSSSEPAPASEPPDEVPYACDTSASGELPRRSSSCSDFGRRSNFCDERQTSTTTSMGVGVCRVCLCDEEHPKDDPMISPCKCCGSMKDIHLKCLRTWIEGRLNISSDASVVSFFWRSLECELCRTPYPTLVSITSAPYLAAHPTLKLPDGAFVELYEIPKPDLPYIVLEPIITNQSPTISGGLYFLSLAHNRIARLGRGHDVDVRLADISVSRLHATIRWQLSSPINSRLVLNEVDEPPTGGSVVLEDNDSKFGTLLQIRRPIRLEPGRDLCLQVGRTILYFTSKRRWRFLPACFRPLPVDTDIMCQQSLRSRHSSLVHQN